MRGGRRGRLAGSRGSDQVNEEEKDALEKVFIAFLFCVCTIGLAAWIFVTGGMT
jgi:hypothetical protein